MVDKLSVVYVDVSEFIHTDILPVNELNLNDRGGNFFVHVDSEQIYTSRPGFAVRVCLSVDKNYQVVYSLKFEKVSRCGLKGLKGEPFIGYK